MVSMSTGDSSLTLGEDQDGIHFTQYKCIVTLIYQICKADIWINMNSFTMLKPKPIYLKLYCAFVQCKCCSAVAVMGLPVSGGWLGSTSPLMLLLLVSSSPDSSDSPLRSTVVDRQKRKKVTLARSCTCRPTTWLALTDFVAALTQTWTTPCSTSSTVEWDEVMWRI